MLVRVHVRECVCSHDGSVCGRVSLRREKTDHWTADRKATREEILVLDAKGQMLSHDDSYVCLECRTITSKTEGGEPNGPVLLCL